MDHCVATHVENHQEGVTVETVSHRVNALVSLRAQKLPIYQLVVRQKDAEQAILEYIGCPARDRLRDKKNHMNGVS